MKSILDFLANETDGKSYKSYKYCFEDVEVPKLEYDDKKEIRIKRRGETDRNLKTTKSIEALAKGFLESPFLNISLTALEEHIKLMT
jgi:hypothetical protein